LKAAIGSHGEPLNFSATPAHTSDGFGNVHQWDDSMKHGPNRCCGEVCVCTNAKIAARLMDGQALQQATALRSMGMSELNML
jgi:hypothetical protein